MKTGLGLYLAMFLVAVGFYGCGGGDSTAPNPRGPVLSSGYSSFELLPLPGDDLGAAHGINDGISEVLIVGTSTQGEVKRPVSWRFNPSEGVVGDARLLETADSAAPGAAYGVNDLGAVVGQMEGASGMMVPVLWSPDSPTPRALSLTIDGVEYTGGVARGINAGGIIVGEAVSASGSVAVIWDGADGNPWKLPALFEGASSAANFICDSDCVVGYSENADGFLRAMLWSSSDRNFMVDLGVLPGHEWSRGWGVDVSGDVVGESVDRDGVAHAVLWKRGAAGNYTAIALGADASARALNDFEHFAGRAGNEAVVWDASGTAHPVLEGGRAGEAVGMNNAGTVIGNSEQGGFVALPKKVN